MNFNQAFIEQQIKIFKSFATDVGTYQKKGDPLPEPILDVYAHIERNTEELKNTSNSRTRGVTSLIKISFLAQVIDKPVQGDLFTTDSGTVYQIRDIVAGDNLTWMVTAVING